MFRTLRIPAALLAVALLLAAAGTASAQAVYVTPAPVVTYYTPPVVTYAPRTTVTYYYAPPVVSSSYYVAPVVTYAPTVVVAPYATTTTYRGLLFPRREVTVTRYYGPRYGP